jgi:hypothetical protein
MFKSKKEKLKYFIENIPKNSFVQSQKKWFEQNGFLDCVDLLDDDLEKTKINLFSFVYGKGICKNCNNEHTKLLNRHGWKKWAKCCSEKCENELHSKRQKGKNNSSHRMTIETKQSMKFKLSLIMKDKIKKGTFTPKSENYQSFGMIEFKQNNVLKKVRSLWELIYWINNEHLEYEKIRIEYFDSLKKQKRIYISDFYDINNNTIIEIKPKKYQDVNFLDKKKACIDLGYNFLTVDEHYFNNCKNQDMINKIKNCVVDFSKIEKKLKWLKKV